MTLFTSECITFKNGVCLQFFSVLIKDFLRQIILNSYLEIDIINSVLLFRIGPATAILFLTCLFCQFEYEETPSGRACSFCLKKINENQTSTAWPFSLSFFFIASLCLLLVVRQMLTERVSMAWMNSYKPIPALFFMTKCSAAYSPWRLNSDSTTPTFLTVGSLLVKYSCLTSIVLGTESADVIGTWLTSGEFCRGMASFWRKLVI